MKKIFTLVIMGAMSLITKTSFAQINENFDNGLAPLSANCWQFVSMMYASSPSAYVINGGGSLYSEPPVNADSVRIVRTPLLSVANTVDVSFKYRLSNNLTGQATRKITVDLVFDNGNVAQNLATFNVANNATTTVTFSQTFNVTTPAVYRLAVSLTGGGGAGNVRLSLDDLTVSSVVIGCPQNGPLPVKLISFQGNKNENKISLNWSVATNETANRFEIERSADGRDFVTAGIVMATEKFGAESYSFNESFSSDKLYYRLKMYDTDQKAEYSRTLILQSRSLNDYSIKIINNPVQDKLTLSFSSATTEPADIKVYDISGRVNMAQKITIYKGSNLVSLPLNNNLNKGMYVVELRQGTTVSSAKFIKQ